MKLDKLTGFIGADVTDVDLRNPVPEPDVLRNALARHGVLVFRGQRLDRTAQKEATRAFGPIMRLPYVEPMEGDPDIIAVLKEASEVNVGVFGGDWHSDFSFLPNPPAGSLLNAAELPPVGGDTVFASQTKAYETLPDHLKDMLEGRDAIHVGKPYGVKFAPPEKTRSGASIKMTRGDPDADRETRHPAVITCPLTAQKALFLNPIYVTRLDGLTEEESRPFLDAIYRHCTRPDFCYRHRWQVGDLLIWDNRLTMHYATNDYDGHRRLLYRTTFAADPPV